MKAALLTLLHLAVTAARLCRPGGVRGVIAENLLLKQQLIVLRRPRQRAPNPTTADRLLCGLASLLLNPSRIRKVAVGLRPSTLLAFHRALVRRKYRRLFSSSHCPRTPRAEGAERRARPRHRRAQDTESSLRLPAHGPDHLADVRRRHRQERRLPGARQALSACPERLGTVLAVVHRPRLRQPLKRGSLPLCVHRAPELLGARRHGPVHPTPGRLRRAPWAG